MISSKDVKIKIPDNFTSEYIENELKNMGLDVIRWAVTGIDGDYYIVNTAAVKD